VVVAAPEQLTDHDLVAIAEGLADVASRTGVTVAGGDLVTSPALMLSVTSIGYEPEGSRLVTRAGAEPGHVIAVTGELGGAAAAITLREGGEARAGEFSAELRDGLLKRQLDPEPRLREGRALAAAGRAR
jgi:thiamine-monophosphate kinase